MGVSWPYNMCQKQFTNFILNTFKVSRFCAFLHPVLSTLPKTLLNQTHSINLLSKPPPKFHKTAHFFKNSLNPSFSNHSIIVDTNNSKKLRKGDAHFVISPLFHWATITEGSWTDFVITVDTALDLSLLLNTSILSMSLPMKILKFFCFINLL